MADQPTPSDPGRGPAEAGNWQDYAGAMRTVRAARGLFLVLLLLSLLTHLGVYGLGRWTRLLSDTEAAQQESQSPVAAETVQPPEPAEPQQSPVQLRAEDLTESNLGHGRGYPIKASTSASSVSGSMGFSKYRSHGTQDSSICMR